MWQVLAAIFLVGGTSAGAFVLSYNTPTVGLGCRTGGYLIFFVVALVLLLAEITVWWLTSPLRKHDHFHVHLKNYTERMHSHKLARHTSLPGLAASKIALARLLKVIEKAVLEICLFPVRLSRSKRKTEKLKTMEEMVREHFATLQNLTTRNWLQRVFFTPLEFFNMVWVCYMIMAQTIGAFNNCACMTSSWGDIGGCLDFTQFNVADSPYVAIYWIQGTVITCVVMAAGMGYIVFEVCIMAQ